MIYFVRRWLIYRLVKLLVGTLSDIPKETLTKEAEDGLLSQLWDNPAFRKRIADRDAKLIYTMAGGEGMSPEPRDQYLIHAGQRVENLLLARDAKAAWNRKHPQTSKVVN